MPNLGGYPVPPPYKTELEYMRQGMDIPGGISGQGIQLQASGQTQTPMSGIEMETAVGDQLLAKSMTGKPPLTRREGVLRGVMGIAGQLLKMDAQKKKTALTSRLAQTITDPYLKALAVGASHKDMQRLSMLEYQTKMEERQAEEKQGWQAELQKRKFTHERELEKSRQGRVGEREKRILDIMSTYNMSRGDALRVIEKSLRIETDEAGVTWIVDLISQTRKRLDQRSPRIPAPPVVPPATPVVPGADYPDPGIGSGTLSAPPVVPSATPEDGETNLKHDRRRTIFDALHVRGAVGPVGVVAEILGKTVGQLFKEGNFPHINQARQRLRVLREDILRAFRLATKVPVIEQERLVKLVPSLGMLESYRSARDNLTELKYALMAKRDAEVAFIRDGTNPPDVIKKSKRAVHDLNEILKTIGDPPRAQGTYADPVRVRTKQDAKNLPPGTYFRNTVDGYIYKRY